MAQAKKIDIINNAYSQMRISGLTVDPGPEDVELALVRLEEMAAEFETRGICVNYNFTEQPDPDDDSNIPLGFRLAFSAPLAIRLVDFGKAVPPELQAQASQSLSNLSARSFQLNETQYPHRMPLGSGNTLRTRRWQRYYQPSPRAPIDCATHYMTVTNINDFSETWERYLNEGETIVSFVRTFTPGLSIVSESLTTPVINFRVKALEAGYQAIEYTATTSDGRVNVRIVNFEVSPSPIETVTTI